MKRGDYVSPLARITQSNAAKGRANFSRAPVAFEPVTFSIGAVDFTSVAKEMRRMNAIVKPVWQTARMNKAISWTTARSVV